jgi:hypothetical protein
MFPGAYFAKTMFTGFYFAPNDGGSFSEDAAAPLVGMVFNIGTMMGRR